MTIRLSKSKVIAFRQCPKRLWLEIHRPELRIDDAGSQLRFAAGNTVGEIAREQYPGGLLIAPNNDLKAALQETKVEVERSIKRPLFEATFQANDVLVRVDLLLPSARGWALVEVKSSTGVKDYHLEDAAIQTWVAKNAGIEISSTSVQVIDSQWTYPGKLQYAGLFKQLQVDEAIASHIDNVASWVEDAKDVAAGNEPQQEMGPHCDSPFSCGFKAHCSVGLAQAEYPVAWLPNLHWTKRVLLEDQQITDLREVEPELLSETQRRVQFATQTGDVFRSSLSDSEKAMLAGVRYYIDFETIAFAVPIWAGTRPYEKIPFQWSCHIEQLDGTLEHHMFLDISGNNPERDFAKSLIAVVGTTGPVIVYHQSFESGVVARLAAKFPELASRLLAINERMVDLLPLTRTHYYHPDMQGSWSIKNVLPTIRPDLAYATLTGVADGGGAMEAYAEAIAVDTPAGRREQLEGELRSYCERDTEAMVHLLNHLHNYASTTASLAL